MGLFELVEDVAERTLRFGRILPFLFANVFFAKRRNRVGHWCDYVLIVAHALRAGLSGRRPHSRASPGFWHNLSQMRNVQIFGVKNSSATRAAERFFKERR